MTDRCEIPGCTNPGVERFPDPCWSSSTLVCEEHRSRFQPSAFDQAAVRLAGCQHCSRRGYTAYPLTEADNERLQCPHCNGTGLDPERVEVLRGFERDVIERCAATLAAYEFHAKDCGDRLVMKLTAEQARELLGALVSFPGAGFKI